MGQTRKKVLTRPDTPETRAEDRRAEQELAEELSRPIKTMRTAIELITYERERQVSVEGWTPAHDDQHGDGELARAAAVYALPHHVRERRMRSPYSDTEQKLVEVLWAWESKWWKPTPDRRLRELVKAGALILAEIERYQRAKISLTQSLRGFDHEQAHAKAGYPDNR